MVNLLENISSYSIPIESSIRDAIIILNNGHRVCVIINKDSSIYGIVTDGDIRRGLMQGILLEDSVTSVANKNPFLIQDGLQELEMKNLLNERNHIVAPIINAKGTLVGLVKLEDLEEKYSKTLSDDCSVLIMAGGFGKRLKPLTDKIPKPMINVGGKPILENLILSFKRQGFNEFMISVNYLSNVIMEHFGDGSKFGIKIQYIEETDPLGTAGALSLIKDFNKHTVIINGDILHKIDFRRVLEFHIKKNNDFTVCSKQYSYELPYGNIELNNDFEILSLEEKPILNFIISGGAYIISPTVKNLIKPNAHIDMPELINRAINNKMKVRSFLLHEDWIDIGIPRELQLAREFYDK